jgi:biopolymer transport protein ExbB
MFAEFDWAQAISNSPIMIALIAASVVTLGVTIERSLYFWKRRGNPDAALENALKKIDGGRQREALWTFENNSHPMGTVAAAVFNRIIKGLGAVEQELQVALSRQKLLLERNLNVLGTMAAVAPLIGLLGTVWGIMRAFHDMAQTGSAAPSVVAAGVAEALLTTAAGLVVAVPAVMLYNHFARRMNVMLTVAENHTRSLWTVLLEKGFDQVGPSSDAQNNSQKSDKPASDSKMKKSEPEMAR